MKFTAKMKYRWFYTGKTIAFFLICSLLFIRYGNTKQVIKGDAISEDNFKNPPTENWPLALWAWLNGYVDTTKMVYELEQMKEKGMRGAFIWDVGAISDPEKMVPAGDQPFWKKSH